MSQAVQMAVDRVIIEMPPIVLEMFAKHRLQISDPITEFRCLAYEIRPNLRQVRLCKSKARVVNGKTVPVQEKSDAARLDSRPSGQIGQETIDHRVLRCCVPE